MIRLKVSYERPEEVEYLVRILSPELKKCRYSGQQGRFFRAYMDMETVSSGVDSVTKKNREAL